MSRNLPVPAGMGGRRYYAPSVSDMVSYAKYGIPAAAGYAYDRLSKHFDYRSKKAAGRKRRRAKSGTGVVRRDRASKKVKTKIKKGGNRRTKSLKSRVQALEKDQPDTKLHFRQLIPMSCRSVVNAQNQSIYQLPSMSFQKLEDQLVAVDYGTGDVNLTDPTKNSKIPITAYSKFEIVNGSLATVDLKCVFVRARENAPKTPVEELIEYAKDRGFTFADGLILSAPFADGVNSLKPSHLRLTGTESLYEILSYLEHNAGSWKQIGKIQSTSLAPGDKLTMSKSWKYNYLPEVRDRAYKSTDSTINETQYIKGWTHYLIVAARGQISHGNTVATNDVVGYCDHQLDCLGKHYFTAKVQNGLGQEKFGFDHTLVNTTSIDWEQAGPTTAKSNDDVFG